MKKHVDTVIILSAILSAVFWMNGKFNEIDKRFYEIEKDMHVLKAVMIMKNIMPNELANANGKE